MVTRMVLPVRSTSSKRPLTMKALSQKKCVILSFNTDRVQTNSGFLVCVDCEAISVNFFIRKRRGTDWDNIYLDLTYRSTVK